MIHISNDADSFNAIGVPLNFECRNCEHLFNFDTHLNHICEFNSEKEFIPDLENNPNDFNAFENSKAVCILKDNWRYLNSVIDDFPMERSDIKSSKSHTCKICKRSYVHAAGLARHIKTHGSNMQKMAKSQSVTKRIEDVKAICQCLFCGRIFSSCWRAFKHYQNDHEFKLERTIDENYNEHKSNDEIKKEIVSKLIFLN